MNYQGKILLISLLLSCAIHAAAIALIQPQPAKRNGIFARPVTPIHFRTLPHVEDLPKGIPAEVSASKTPPPSAPDAKVVKSSPVPITKNVLEARKGTDPGTENPTRSSFEASPPKRRLHPLQGPLIPASSEEPEDEKSVSSPSLEEIPPPRGEAKNPVATLVEKEMPSPSAQVSDAAPSVFEARMDRERTASLQGMAASSTESREDTFRTENFSGIRGKILAHLRYPPIARRMRWEGEVEVRFVLHPDGHPRDVAVAGSSGHAVLDDSATAAVLRAAPFPRPSEEADIVVPVRFRLTP